MDPRLEAWAGRGDHITVDGRQIFVWEQGSGRPLVALHGFPASSYDWRVVANMMSKRRFVALDFPGFGLSDKAPNVTYSLFAYADVVETVLAQLGIKDCDLLAHDMGDSVATELMARANEDKLSFSIGQVALLNGSIFIDLAQLTSGQKLFLRMKPRPMRTGPPVKLFRRQLKKLFSPEHPASNEEIEMLETFLTHEDGHRLLPLTIRYIEERRANTERWTSALVDFEGPLHVLWGDLDPIAVPAMVERLSGLRPDTNVIRWRDVAHWPQIEVPHRVATELQKALA